MFNFVQFKMANCEKRIQSATWIWEILVMFRDVLLCKLLFLAFHMGIPINQFKLKIMCTD